MVLGIGTDLIEIDRIEQSIARFGERFLQRIFTSSEIAFCRRKKNAAESFAARFAAKEAAAKALGTGISRGIAWTEIEVRRQPGEPPSLHWSGRAQLRAQQIGVQRTVVSLTHTRIFALAVVLVESSKDEDIPPPSSGPEQVEPLLLYPLDKPSARTDPLRRNAGPATL